MDRVKERDDSAADAEIPERHRNNAAAFNFALEPLHKETRREQSLSREADDQPDMLGRDPAR